MRKKLSAFINELLLYSGQYALFYIIMNFSNSGIKYFEYNAHVYLILALISQTYILYKFGERASVRFMGSLICPFIYTVFEIHEFSDFILNIGHFFFWTFSLMVGLLSALKIKSKGKIRLALEFTTVFMNVVIFIFIYMYFDIKLGQASLSTQVADEYSSALSVKNIGKETINFLSDRAHIYITVAGLVLGVGLGMSQVKVIRLKDKIHDLFGKYVDTSIRDTLIENDGVYNEKRELCILFCDIRNFTTVSEKAESSKLIKSLNRYFTLWEKTSYKHGGVINKFIGDAVMIVFGLNGLENPESRAVECSKEILKSLEMLNQELHENALVSFEKIGIGIHSGKVVLGNVGGENRKEFTVIGDVVNTASRLEALTKKIDQDLLISQDVYERLSTAYMSDFAYYDSVELKGKSKALKVYKYNKQ
ncbi:adenylate/guanylate cyclase domain-containing protein [Fusibacter sp. JL216-2]|uniref:adenylate/guanylate cyclase domain-containing protein n=1 Tax=Fusibacter sp. JL216-2 TaxID=3071453 RepID=UPI003D3295AC